MSRLSNARTELENYEKTRPADYVSQYQPKSKDVMGQLDGMKEFDKEGIQELKKLAGDDLENIITRVRALKKADEQYNNFSGLEKGKTGSVRFIVETDEIKK